MSGAHLQHSNGQEMAELLYNSRSTSGKVESISHSIFMALNSQGNHRGVQKEERGHHLNSKRAEKSPKLCLNTVTKTLFEYTPLCNKRRKKRKPQTRIKLKISCPKDSKGESICFALYFCGAGVLLLIAAL